MATIPYPDDHGAPNSSEPAGAAALTWAEALFAAILASLAASGAIPPAKVAEMIAYLAEHRAGEKAP